MLIQEILFNFFVAIAALLANVHSNIYSYEGSVSQYAPGVMEIVLNNHNIPEEVREEMDFFYATLSCSHRGKRISLTVGGTTYNGLVVDCATYLRFPEDVFWMVRDNIIGEVDFEFAERIGYAGRGFYGRAEISRSR